MNFSFESSPPIIWGYGLRFFSFSYLLFLVQTLVIDFVIGSTSVSLDKLIFALFLAAASFFIFHAFLHFYFVGIFFWNSASNSDYYWIYFMLGDALAFRFFSWWLHSTPMAWLFACKRWCYHNLWGDLHAA